MNARTVPESDWRLFRVLRERALERFCKRVLDEVAPVLGNTALTHHERYMELSRTLKDRDAQLSQAFDDPRRSRMIHQLAAIHMLRLVEPSELEAFTSETRTAVETVAQLGNESRSFP